MHLLRVSAGAGFRTPNIFIDDRFGFVNGRKIVIADDIKTELAYGVTISYEAKIRTKGHQINLEVKPFFTAILNKIEADRFALPNTVVYNNDGNVGFNYGLTLSSDLQFQFPLRAYIGVTLLQNIEMKNDGQGASFIDALNSPVLNATFSINYTWKKAGLVFDFNGTVNSPMRLPTVPNDYRSERSPWFGLLNFQVTKRFAFGLEIYVGVNNILDVKPTNTILRPNDPFNNQVNDLDNNPRNYRFNSSYIFAPNQGVKAFGGIRYTFVQKDTKSP